MLLPRVTAVLALVMATGAAPATARASWGHPNSSVSGGMRITWTSDSGDTKEVGSTLAHADGVVRYTIIDRAIGNSALRAWVPGEFPSWADKRVGNGFLMRARLEVDRFTASARTVCDGGQMAEVTTRVTGIPQSHALLATEEPTIDLVGGHGTVDLDLPFLIHRDGVIRLGQVVVGTGAVELTTTGTVCSTNEDGAPIVIVQDPSVRTLAGADLMGAKVVTAVDDGFRRMQTTVARDGSLTLAPKPRKLVNDDGFQAYETISGSFEPQLHLGGPPAGQSSECTIPTFTEMRRVRSLAAARALVRAHGFPGVALAPSRAAIPRQDRDARFLLDFGSPTSICGQPLGSRRYPVLVPLRR
jgi:hypothetical protein